MRKKVLIIDDEPDFVEMVGARLAAHGYEVHTAGNGHDGLAAARSTCPDIILLDINMPDLDGGDVAHQIKSDPQIKDTPVVFLTALVGETEATQSQSDPTGEHFLSKTGGSQKIIEYIQRVTG